jgi:hypothetical protein
MTDGPDFEDPAFDEIRSLLSDARATEPMPADVAAGLDDVLAGLLAERSAELADDSTSEAEVIPLRRRPGWSSRLLGAAAAVVLLGAGGAGLRVVLSHSGSPSTANVTTADRAASAPVPTPPKAFNSTETGATAGGVGGSAGLGGSAPATPQTQLESGSPKPLLSLAQIRFTRARFDVQAAGYFKQVLAMDRVSAGSATSGPGIADGPSNNYLDAWSGSLGDLRGAKSTTPDCPGPVPNDGAAVYRITFDKHAATLAVHPVVNGSAFVVAWSCDGTQPLAFTTVTP